MLALCFTEWVEDTGGPDAVGGGNRLLSGNTSARSPPVV